MVKSGVELAYEVLTSSGIKEESAYYESLHETPLAMNTIARKKLFEMNRTISDTAEYGCYLFNHGVIAPRVYGKAGCRRYWKGAEVSMILE